MSKRKLDCGFLKYRENYIVIKRVEINGICGHDY